MTCWSPVSDNRFPLRTEDEDYVSTRSRIPPARQLCHGSNRELPARPKKGQCPVCERKLEVTEVSTGRRDPKTRDIVFVYILPSHMMKRTA